MNVLKKWKMSRKIKIWKKYQNSNDLIHYKKAVALLGVGRSERFFRASGPPIFMHPSPELLSGYAPDYWSINWKAYVDQKLYRQLQHPLPEILCLVPTSGGGDDKSESIVVLVLSISFAYAQNTLTFLGIHPRCHKPQDGLHSITYVLQKTPLIKPRLCLELRVFP